MQRLHILYWISASVLLLAGESGAIAQATNPPAQTPATPRLDKYNFAAQIGGVK